MYTKGSTSVTTTVAPSARSNGAPRQDADVSSWYSKLAHAWGSALDRQADRTVSLAQQVSAGSEGPGQALIVSAAAQQLTFLCTAASNVSSSIGNALETLGRKQ